ncbi:transcriptional regulator GntR [Flavobacteria bacterium BBFL7]|nr:transcriptional regulator GntR [Flavobacteria bacterium BBFL7]
MIEHGLKLVTTDDTENIVTQENDVVSEIRALIKKHNLEAGDKLPSERKLSEKLGVSRNQIRAGIQKLEFYGIIETLPQSGSIITGIGVPSMNTMMNDVLDLETPDFNALVETRVIIESKAVQLAASRCTPESLKKLEIAHQNFVDCITNGLPSLIEDMKFHLAIVKASENSVLYGLMKIIVPDIIGHFNKEDICDRTQAIKLISEHTEIIEAIKNKKSDDALEALNTHFIALRKYTIK